MNAGIICEYNPFHHGHEYHISETKRLLPDHGIICVMSGNFVQRGEAAVMRKHARAEAAVKSGADLVLELPLPWAMATAEKYAFGGVSVLKNTGVCDHLSFGSESGDLEKLQKVCDALLDERLNDEIRLRLKDGDSFAAVREEAVKKLVGTLGELLRDPNDILGVEYLKAIKKLGADITPVAVRRKGAKHDSAEENGVLSASAIRGRLIRGEKEALSMPQSAMEIYEREYICGRAPVKTADLETAVLAKLRTMTEEDYSLLPDSSEGLHRRLRQCALSAPTLDDLLMTAKTKRYPMARIRRMVMSAALGITKEDSAGEVPYISVLAMNERGAEILAEMKSASRVPVITKPSSALKMPEISSLYSKCARADDIYALLYPEKNQRVGGQSLRQSPIVIRGNSME